MTRRIRPSRKALLKLLTEAAFDPRVDGPLSFVVDLNDPGYCETKAIELVTEARQCLATSGQYHVKLTQAIGLLALARLQRTEGSNAPT